MDKEPLSYPPGGNNNNNNNNKIIIILLLLSEKVSPPELANRILSYYVQGSVARQVIDYILEHGAFTIPTLTRIFRVPRETIYYILRRLSPWVIQTSVRLEPPIRSPGNKPYIWRRQDVELPEAVDEARIDHYDILKKHDPAVKATDEMGQRLLEDLGDRSEVTYREILVYLKEKGVSGPEGPRLADNLAKFLGRSGVKVWR